MLINHFPLCRYCVTFSFLLVALNSGEVAQSQNLPLTPDTSLGTQVAPNMNGSVQLITGGQQVGKNLFHSFSEFNVNPNQQVFFDNPSNVGLILSRVTGNNLSQILGTLGTRQEGTLLAPGIADLFLINPNGITFGPGAQLFLGGSFIASTAEQVIFRDGTLFSASNPVSTPLLSMAVPIGLQFGNRAAPIEIQDSILVGPLGETLGFLGGDISISGGNLPFGVNNINAPGGRVELGSVAPDNIVDLVSGDRGWILDYSSVKNFQDIALINRASVDVTDFSPLAPPPFNSIAIGSGEIQVQGRIVELISGSSITSATLGDMSAGDIVINASELVRLDGFGFVVDPTGMMFPSSSAITSTTFSDGDAADIFINTKRLSLGGGSLITSSLVVPPGFSLGALLQALQGSGGDIAINASQSVEVSGSVPEIGQSVISTQIVFAFGTSPNPALSTGNAGNVLINTSQLRVLDGGEITTETATGGQGGTARINASDSILVSGFGLDSVGNPATSSINSLSTGTGNAGTLNLNTEQLTIRDGGEISVSSLGSSDAGDIDLNITGTGTSLLLDNRGQISAATASGQGGDVIINTVNGLLFLNNNSAITTTAMGTGNGGDITIDAQQILLGNQSQIIANAEAGDGGNINIQAQGLFICPTCSIDASSELGVDGLVEINRPETDPDAGLVDLPDNVLERSDLVVRGCDGGRAIATGEFIITGWGGIPLSPQRSMDLANVVHDLGETPPEQIRPSSQTGRSPGMALSPQNPNAEPLSSIVEAKSWIQSQDGRVILTQNSAASSPNIPGVSPTCYGSPPNQISTSPSIDFSLH